MFEGWFDKIFDAASFKKMMIVLAFSPVWFPIAKAFWKEIQGALAPDGGFMGRGEAKNVEVRQPGLDPWLSVPHQRRGAAARKAAAAASSARPSAARGSTGAARATTGTPRAPASAPPAAGPARARRRGF